MGQKKTVRQGDIARELGISTVSVSNALKGNRGVSRTLRAQIQKKARELGYEYTPPAPKRETKHYSLGVVIAERYVRQFPSFYMDIYRQVAQAAGRKGNMTILKVVDEESERTAAPECLFENVDIDGILVIGEMAAEFVERRKELPIVCVDFCGMAKDIDYVVSDNLHGMQRVTEALVQKGHTEIAFWGDPHASGGAMDRYMGYCKALRKNGLAEQDETAAYRRSRAAEGKFELPDKLPTAFVCGSDRDAYALIERLRTLGLQVPGDISVAGFGHTRCQSAEGLFLDTYEVDEKALAEVSVDTLLRRISAGGASVKEEKGIQMVQGRLIRGNTAGLGRKL